MEKKKLKYEREMRRQSETKGEKKKDSQESYCSREKTANFFFF